MSNYYGAVHGNDAYDELLEVKAEASDRPNVTEGWPVIDVLAMSNGDQAYVTLTIEQAEEHIKIVREAIDFLTQP